jgi:hypothetical protein
VLKTLTIRCQTEREKGNFCPAVIIWWKGTWFSRKRIDLRIVKMSNDPLNWNKANAGTFLTFEGNFYMFRYQTGRQETMEWMAACIPWIQSAFSFFMDAFLVLSFQNISTLPHSQSLFLIFSIKQH